MPFVDSLIFIAIVISIAFFAWFVRSFVESEPDPLLLNLTFFAFAGQLILTFELPDKPTLSRLFLGLDVFAFLVVLGQVRVVQAHASKTLKHYEQVLRDNKADEHRVNLWARILLEITGVDFYPEFYQKHVNIRFLRLNTPEDRRKQAVEALPTDIFKDRTHNINEKSLVIEPQERMTLWRPYVYVCALAWALFLSCIIAGRML